MPELDFAVGYEGRPTYGLPSTRAVNVYTEATKAGPKRAARIARPGLTLWNTVGSGPILRSFQNPGIFNADPFFVSGGSLYRSTTSLGTVPYTLQPRLAANLTQLAVVSGGALYIYNGTTFTLQKYFDDGSSLLPPFSSVAVLYNIFVYTVAGSAQFFWSAAGNAASINAANTTFAQTTPDPIVEVVTLAEELYFFKAANATEIWDFNPIVNAAGQVTQPFQLSQGRTYIRGAAAQGGVVSKIDNAVIWIGDDLEVYRSSFVPQKISTPFIDDRLRAAKATIDQTAAFALGIEGHWLYVMNLPGLGESYAYDCATQQWAQWATEATFSSDPGPYIGYCSAGQGASIYVGDKTSGKVYLADVATNTDNGQARVAIASAAIWVTGGTMRLNNVSLACVRGVGTATAPAPQVWARFSYDGGRSFPTSWIPATLGMVGQYRIKAVWRNLGLIQQPGVIIEFAILDSVNVVIEGGSWNEARP